MWALVDERMHERLAYGPSRARPGSGDRAQSRGRDPVAECGRGRDRGASGIGPVIAPLASSSPGSAPSPASRRIRARSRPARWQVWRAGAASASMCASPALDHLCGAGARTPAGDPGARTRCPAHDWSGRARQGGARGNSWPQPGQPAPARRRQGEAGPVALAPGSLARKTGTRPVARSRPCDAAAFGPGLDRMQGPTSATPRISPRSEARSRSCSCTFRNRDAPWPKPERCAGRAGTSASQRRSAMSRSISSGRSGLEFRKRRR